MNKHQSQKGNFDNQKLNKANIIKETINPFELITLATQSMTNTNSLTELIKHFKSKYGLPVNLAPEYTKEYIVHLSAITNNACVVSWIEKGLIVHTIIISLND